MSVTDRYTQSQTRLTNSVTELDTATALWRRNAANAHLAAVLEVLCEPSQAARFRAEELGPYGLLGLGLNVGVRVRIDVNVRTMIWSGSWLRASIPLGMVVGISCKSPVSVRVVPRSTIIRSRCFCAIISDN